MMAGKLSSHARVILVLFGFSACWLVVGSFLAALAAGKLIWPQLLDGPSWLTYGRIAPVALNALVYGWASSAGMGIALWLLGELGGSRLLSGTVPVIAAFFWQIALLVGLCGILAGYGHSALLLEFPTSTGPLLLVAYLGMAFRAYLLFRTRVVRDLFASTWYLIGALLWFPWIFSTGWIFLIGKPVSGSAQAPLAAWVFGGLANLWLAPLALAVIYYLVPLLLGRRLVSYNLSFFAFWIFSFFGTWAGLAQLIGGPVPAWMAAAGGVAAMLLCIPVLIIGGNIFGTIRASSNFEWSPSLSFVVVAAGAFLCVYLENALLALPGISGIFRFTDVVLGQGMLFLYGMVSLAFFAAIYHIVPVSSDERLMKWHFRLALAGALGGFVCLTLGGMVQGFAQVDVDAAFMISVSFVEPFRFLAGIFALSFFAGSLCFAAWLFRVVWKTLLPPTA